MKKQSKKLSKKAKFGIVAAVTAVVAAATASVLFLTGVINFKLGSLSTEKYEIVGIDFVSMTQKGAHTYDLNVTLEEKFAESGDVKLYLSKNDTFNTEKSRELIYDKKQDGTFQINNITYNAGDYFLYVKVGEETGIYPLTIPKMSPKTWMNGDIVNIEFEVDGNTSWSSFIDPTGKNVYRSASKIFDDTAVIMEENIDILTSSFSDSNATKDEPYYYIVFNGKNGKFRYISAPLFYTATQGDVEAKFYEEKDKPYLELSGNLYAVSEEAERVMQLRVGNYNGDDPTSTFMVDNIYSGGDKTAFTFKIPLENLKEASNNLVIFLTENGTMCEWSINVSNLDLSAYTFSSGIAQYGLTDENALKITRMLDAYDNINVTLDKTSEGAVLKVQGTHKYGVGGKDYQLILTATDGQQYMAENEVNEGKKFSFEFPLEQLYSSGVWYDIQVKCVNEIAYYDIASSAANLEESVTVGEKKYNFEEYGGLLKIQYSIVKDFSGLKASITTDGGKPVLFVSGTIKDTKAENLSLAIRTGDTVYTSANAEKEDGKFSATMDLTQMAEKDSWYDVLIYYKDDNQYYDMATSNADMNQKLEAGKSVYTFQDWEGQLKVNCSDAPVKINSAKAIIETEGDTSYLVVTGTAEEEASTYKLGIRNEDNYVTSVSNLAGGKKLKFKVNLAALPKSSTWYDIIIGHKGFSDSADLTTDAADMETSVTTGKRIYKFADWEGQLKVYFNNKLAAIKGVTAEIKEVDGKGFLIVKGTMKNASQKYLGIRTEDKVINVSNTGKGDKIYFKFNLSKLSSVDTWYDIIIGTNGSDVYRDLTIAAADMEQTVTIGKRIYAFQNWEEALKISYSKIAGDLKDVEATITTKNGKPVLKVAGTIKNASSMYLGIRTGDTVYKKKNKGDGNNLSFTFDLTKLKESGTWYDVIIGNKDFSSYKDVTVKSANMEDSASYKSKNYKFAEWNNQLKVYFEDDTATGLKKGQTINDVKAVLLLKNGKPVLRVQGTMKGINNDNLQLGIRTDDKVVKAANLTKTEGRFLFDYDLTKLSKSGTWYDIVLIEKESGTYVDVKTKSVYSMDVSITYDENVYRFADWEGDLKIYYTNTAEEEAAKAKVAENFTNVKAEIASSNDKPVLKITASIGSLEIGDVTLNVRSGDTVITVKNTSAKKGMFSAVVDLTKLTSKGTWYDVYWNVDSVGTEINLTAEQADMSSNYKYNGYTYQFKEWNSQLKVEFE